MSHNLNGLRKPHYLIEALNYLDEAEAIFSEHVDHIPADGINSDPAYESTYFRLSEQLERARAYAHQMYNRWDAEQRAERYTITVTTIDGMAVAIPSNVKEFNESISYTK